MKKEIHKNTKQKWNQNEAENLNTSHSRVDCEIMATAVSAELLVMGDSQVGIAGMAVDWHTGCKHV